MSANILIILGSPRKKGNSAILADAVSQGAKAEGAEVESVFLSGLDINPCRGCDRCQEESAKGCVIKDDMVPLYSKIQKADSIVIASPVYWFNISAQTKIFIDRLYAVGVEEKNIFKGKTMAALLTYADADPYSSGAVNALRSYQDIFKYLEVNSEEMIYGSAGDPGEIKNNLEIIKQAEALGKRLAN